MTNIYVLSKDGHPLMPIHRKGRARRMIRDGKANVVKKVPFTIQLTYDIPDAVTDECLLGIDPGRTNIGLCVIDEHGNVLFASDVVTRNKAIRRLMMRRKEHRQASRRGERLRRQRRAMRSDKTGMAAHTQYWRMLAGYEKPVCCKVFRNSNARFANRKRPDGWLTPTAGHLLQTHLNLVRKLMKLLPLSGIVVEINRFDFQRMEHPFIKNWQYQKGRLAGFKDVYDAVSSRQEGKCLKCRKADIEHYHHIIPKSRGGADTLDNLAGLCCKCHTKVHTSEKALDDLIKKHEGLRKKYHALSVINQIMPKLLNELPRILPTYVTTGYETMLTRGCFGLKKDHYIDAWCIAVSVMEYLNKVRFRDDFTEPDFEGSIHDIRQFRRHDRAIIKAQRERKYYLDGKCVATNRKPRTDQRGKALSEIGLTWMEISALQVKKSERRYNDIHRMLPGALFEYRGQVYIRSGQITNGQYLRNFGDDKTNYPASECRILTNNQGLVFLN